MIGNRMEIGRGSRNRGGEGKKGKQKGLRYMYAPIPMKVFLMYNKHIQIKKQMKKRICSLITWHN